TMYRSARESGFFGCGGNSLPAAGEQRVCGRGLRLLPQGHVQYGVGQTFAVGLVARDRSEAVCTVEAFGTNILFVHIYLRDALFADGEIEQLTAEAVAEPIGVYEEHFEFAVRDACECDGAAGSAADVACDGGKV